MTMKEKLARAMRKTLRHHGVELHPDDIDGLAQDCLATLREPDEKMIEAGRTSYAFSGNADPFATIFTAMIEGAEG